MGGSVWYIQGSGRPVWLTEPPVFLWFQPEAYTVFRKEIAKDMSKKPLADDRRRELATEAFAKVVRAAFKGEADKGREALAAIESQYSEEIDIVDRARRFAAILTTPETKVRPKGGSELLLAGVVALNAGDLEAAARDLGAVLAENPNSADAHYVMAVVLARREKPEEAIGALKTACSLSPERRAQAPLDAEFASMLGNPSFEALTAAA